ncbi:unnamed protein product [Anisakis simplex]|uniref:Protein pangolin n=1 Tax=Anisakis simplex TaxID=6269 RepID=A0A0M3KI80_ANISI|nr:unnamed protein product [Anisakis simplex]
MASSITDVYRRNDLQHSCRGGGEGTAGISATHLAAMDRKRAASTELNRSSADKRSKWSSSSSGDEEEDDALSSGSQDDDESSTVDERTDTTTPNAPIEAFSMQCPGSNLATMFRNHPINTHMSGAVMGYPIQPYFTNMTNAPMSREFAECTNMNMGFLPTHQMAYGMSFPPTSHYAFGYGTSCSTESFVRQQQVEPMNNLSQPIQLPLRDELNTDSVGVLSVGA